MQSITYTQSQKKLYTFVMRIVANLVNNPLKWDRFQIGKTSDCKMPNILLIQLFADRCYAKIRDFNETVHFLATRMRKYIFMKDQDMTVCTPIQSLKTSNRFYTALKFNFKDFNISTYLLLNKKYSDLRHAINLYHHIKLCSFFTLKLHF